MLACFARHLMCAIVAHYGIKERDGVVGEWHRYDEDWTPILAMDASPGQVWFKHPKGREVWGM